MSVQIGPFFYIKNKLIHNTCSLEKGRRQADKLDPRGRVVWDITNNRAIIYIDRCINKPEIISKIKVTFELQNYTVAYDDHYRCRNCVE